MKNLKVSDLLGVRIQSSHLQQLLEGADMIELREVSLWWVGMEQRRERQMELRRKRVNSWD